MSIVMYKIAEYMANESMEKDAGIFSNIGKWWKNFSGATAKPYVQRASKLKEIAKGNLTKDTFGIPGMQQSFKTDYSRRLRLGKLEQLNQAKLDPALKAVRDTRVNTAVGAGIGVGALGLGSALTPRRH